MWTEEQLRMLIDERKNNNEYYHIEMMPQLDLTNRNSWSQICRNIAITMF